MLDFFYHGVSFCNRFISQSSQGPAVTLKIKQHGKTYSIDMALAIKDSSWPDDAEEWRKRTRHGIKI